MKGKKTMKMTNFRWKVAWLIFAISFVSYMDRVNLSVATPVIMKEFGFTKIRRQQMLYSTKTDGSILAIWLP